MLDEGLTDVLLRPDWGSSHLWDRSNRPGGELLADDLGLSRDFAQRIQVWGDQVLHGQDDSNAGESLFRELRDALPTRVRVHFLVFEGTRGYQAVKKSADEMRWTAHPEAE